MDVSNWNWAMWTFFVLSGLSLLGYWGAHGTPRGNWNAAEGTLNFLLTWGLLYFAGKLS